MTSNFLHAVLRGVRPDLGCNIRNESIDLLLALQNDAVAFIDFIEPQFDCLSNALSLAFRSCSCPSRSAEPRGRSRYGRLRELGRQGLAAFGTVQFSGHQFPTARQQNTFALSLAPPASPIAVRADDRPRPPARCRENPRDGYSSELEKIRGRGAGLVLVLQSGVCSRVVPAPHQLPGADDS